MSRLFEELDYRQTPLGTLTLRRRHDLVLGADVLEIKLGDEFLMTSAFTVSEVALARLALAELARSECDVVVGGLGLGYTAQAVLAHEGVSSLLVVETLEPVIDWHRTGRLPLGPAIAGDPRSRFIHGDFFALADGKGFDPERPGRRFDAILVDIDHSPTACLSPAHEAFYRPAGLRALASSMKPGGVFGLWSNERPDAAFTETLAEVFPAARAEPVTFYNPLQDRDCTQTIYLARTDNAP